MKSKGRFKAVQSSNRSKEKEIELTNKEVWRKEKKRRSIKEIDWYIIWKGFNTVADEERVSLEPQNIIILFIMLIEVEKM